MTVTSKELFAEEETISSEQLFAAPTPVPSFSVPEQPLDVEAIVDGSNKNWDISQSLNMHPNTTERWLNMLGTPTTLGVPLPEPVKPEIPVDQPEAEPTFSGQLVGGTIETAKHLADFPRRTLMMIGQLGTRPFPTGEALPGLTSDQIRNDPLYRVAAVISERASVGANFLLNAFNPDASNSLLVIFPFL